MNDIRVLLVSYVFPPHGGTGVMRATSLARYFPAQGIRLDVITARNASAVGTDAELLREVPSSVSIHRTYTFDLPFGIRKRIKRLIKGSAPSDAGAGYSNAGRASPGILTQLVQRILRPDPQVTWVPVLKRVSRRIVTNNKIDLVLITAPPFSSVLLVEKLRKEFPDLPIVVDFRDEWLSTTFDLVSFVFTNGEEHRKFASRVEENAVRNVTAIVTVTEAARREIRCRYPQEPESKFHVLPNGFDASRLRPTQLASEVRRDSRIVITHVGTVYAATEPMVLVKALQSLPPDVKSQFRFRFIGHIEEPRFRDALQQLGDMVDLKGYLPQREALATMNETDYVLLINHDPLNVGGKFYDYIGSGRPILGALNPHGETRRLVEELRVGWWAANDDLQGIRQLFIDAVARGKSPHPSFQPDLTRIAQYERKAIAQRYATLLHSIAGAARRSDVELEAAQVND